MAVVLPRNGITSADRAMACTRANTCIAASMIIVSGAASSRAIYFLKVVIKTTFVQAEILKCERIRPYPRLEVRVVAELLRHPTGGSAGRLQGRLARRIVAECHSHHPQLGPLSFVHRHGPRD